jgi:hypothetical protein
MVPLVWSALRSKDFQLPRPNTKLREDESATWQIEAQQEGAALQNKRERGMRTRYFVSPQDERD